MNHINLPRCSANGAVMCLLACLLISAAQAGPPASAESSTDASPGPGIVLPASVDLRPVFNKWGLSPRIQGKRGTCSVFTVAGALEFAAAEQQRRGERFSVEFLNWSASQITGENRDGGFFSDLCRGFEVYGICSEKAMPYHRTFDPELNPAPEVLSEAKARLALRLRPHWIKEWDVKTGLTEGQLVAIQRALEAGRPVCAGLRWPKKPKWKDGVLEMCSPEAVFDGHSVLLVGYRDEARQAGGGVLLFRNTGDGGRDSAMPYIFARTYVNDALWIGAPAGDKLQQPILDSPANL